MVDRIHRRMLIFLIIVVDQLDRNLCIRIGIKRISLILKLFPEFLVILDNSVMNADDVPVITAMRVRIQLTRLPVRRPARMTDPAGSLHRYSIIRLLCENAETAFRLDDLHILLPVTYCDSRRVISAIL